MNTLFKPLNSKSALMKTKTLLRNWWNSIEFRISANSLSLSSPWVAFESSWNAIVISNTLANAVWFLVWLCTGLNLYTVMQNRNHYICITHFSNFLLKVNLNLNRKKTHSIPAAMIYREQNLKKSKMILKQQQFVWK